MEEIKRAEWKRTVRTKASDFKVREDGDDLHIEGYFAVFDSNYEIADGLSESVDPNAFDNTLGDDIRCLINHDTTLVLGRTKAHTLSLRKDDHGLYGDVIINTKDSDATNLYSRVQRGDVDQASFGFDILSEEYENSENGSVHWTIKEVKLYEVSVCTFPAYQETSLSARSNEAKVIKQRTDEAWRLNMRKKLKGENEDGTKGVNATEED